MSDKQRFARIGAVLAVVIVSAHLDSRTDWFWQSWQSFLALVLTFAAAFVAVAAVDNLFDSNDTK